MEPVKDNGSNWPAFLFLTVLAVCITAVVIVAMVF